MKIANIGLLACLSWMASATPVEVESSKNLEDRQIVEAIEIFIGAIIAGGSGALKAFLGPDMPQCTWKSQYSDDRWWTRLQATVNGQNVTVAEVCWEGGGYAFSDNDVAAAQCLVDLHAQQDFSCIDLGGSSCDTHPGTAVGNVRLLHNWSTDAHQQLDATTADRAKKAIEKFMGLDHGWNIGTNYDMEMMNDDGTYAGWAVQVRGTGDEDC